MWFTVLARCNHKVHAHDDRWTNRIIQWHEMPKGTHNALVMNICFHLETFNLLAYSPVSFLPPNSARLASVESVSLESVSVSIIFSPNNMKLGTAWCQVSTRDTVGPLQWHPPNLRAAGWVVCALCIGQTHKPTGDTDTFTCKRAEKTPWTCDKHDKSTKSEVVKTSKIIWPCSLTRTHPSLSLHTRDCWYLI